MTIYRTRTQDNPYLSPDFVQSLEASYTGKFARQELEGEFVGFEGLVYEEFDRGVHVHDGEHTFVRAIAGVDEGYTNPAVILVLGIDGDGRAFVVEEFYQRRRLQGEVVAEAQRLQAQHHIETFYADPSAAGLIADMRRAGLPVKPARNEVYPGIQAVKARLAVQGDGRTRLAISPSCANTISEFESYCWKESRQGTKDEPEKVNDHAMDALRYAMASMARQARSAASFQG
jgi:phage terminase large subunit